VKALGNFRFTQFSRFTAAFYAVTAVVKLVSWFRVLGGILAIHLGSHENEFLLGWEKTF